MIKNITKKMLRLFQQKHEHERYRRSYSQDGEDMVMAAFFDNMPNYKGFYVDIGAYHPVRFSNTLYFYEQGWRGINVDATPGVMREFMRYRPEDSNEERGIAEEGHNLTLYCFDEGAYNTFDKSIADLRVSQGLKLQSEKIMNTMTINKLLDKFLPAGRTVDFMDLDVEGTEFTILKSLDWSKYAPNYLLVEDIAMTGKDIIGYGSNEMYLFLKAKGYAIVARTQRTIIYRKKAP